ncbi:hypothetical protein C9374_011845 [Naegleria lovaniensis]|uniref:Peptidase M14 domain-containing protein n=1 Tax=Naegleria lovaniensis TaxID=51637 RepID=A0AA88GGP1_NAELO|nr:uncharacterized protein C9374_011845 [Naegleria lovaniensis]KAG2373756.1 hypothetical protein C9374_011845 [Naegleria lovaniensis]
MNEHAFGFDQDELNIDSEPLILGNPRIVNTIDDIEAFIKMVKAEEEEERNDLNDSTEPYTRTYSEEYLSTLIEKNEISNEHIYSSSSSSSPEEAEEENDLCNFQEDVKMNSEQQVTISVNSQAQQKGFDSFEEIPSPSNTDLSSKSSKSSAISGANSQATNSANSQSFPRYTYRGNLMFDASFECGNLEKVVRVHDFEYELYIRGDTFNPSKKMWFYFKVSNVLKNQKVLFTIMNLSKNKSLYRYGMTPIVSSSSRNRWERIPEKQVYYYRKEKGSKRNSVSQQGSNLLSFVFVFDNEQDEYKFAYCYPYSYTDLQKFLFFIECKNFPYFKRSLLCRSVQQRRCDLLTITNIKPSSSSKKRIVMMTSRVHPGETPASYVCHGFISFIVSNHPIAQILRDHLVFKIVPMLNPDGVAIGNYRTCSMGFDLNRHWLNPQEWSQPTIYHVRKYLLELKNDPQSQIDFYMDLHSHSGAFNGFMYVNYASSSSKSDSYDQLRFPKLLDQKAREFSMNDTKRCKDPSKLGTSRRVLGEVLQVAKYCYTLEVSFLSYKSNTSDNSRERYIPFTMENYQSLGKSIALALADFYGLSEIVRMTEQ